MIAKELAEAYRMLFKSNLGKDQISRVETLLNDQLKQAVKSDKNTGHECLKRAEGMQLILDEFKRVQSIDRRGTGRK